MNCSQIPQRRGRMGFSTRNTQATEDVVCQRCLAGALALDSLTFEPVSPHDKLCGRMLVVAGACAGRSG